MSTFEKIIIPLVDSNIRIIDLTSCCGFIDSYISDPDKPSGECELFLVFDDNIRNNFVTDRMLRYEQSPNIKRTYVKYVNNTPFYVYSFWIKPEIKKLYNGIVVLNTSQKAQILQFWGPLDSIVDKVFGNQVQTLDIEHPMPLQDYQSPFPIKCGFKIKRKGTAS